MEDDLEALLDNYKYIRTGYVDLGRKCDVLLAALLEQIPGEGKLPLHWHHRSPAEFQKKHGHRGTVLWAPASSSHLLLIAGQKVMRVWTDSVRTCYVDVNDTIANSLSTVAFAKVVPIPAGNARKCLPFTKRIKLAQNFQMVELAKVVRNTYGLDSSRLSV